MTKFSMEEIFPLIEEGIKNNGKFRFYPKGKSMLPLLVEGEDSVVFISPDNIKKYDMILYRRVNNGYVLHRVIGIRNEEYLLCGDNQCEIEKGIKKEQILAKVECFYKGEKLVDVNNPRYLKYAKNRVASIPIRRAILGMKRLVYRILKRTH